MKHFGKQKNDLSNLPQEVVHKEINKIGSLGRSDLDDSMEGIDKCVDHSVSQVKEHKSYQK